MICYCLCGCTTQSLNNSNTSNPLECQYNSYIDDNYYILSDKIIYLSHLAKEIKNLNIEINTENKKVELSMKELEEPSIDLASEEKATVANEDVAE